MIRIIVTPVIQVLYSLRQWISYSAVQYSLSVVVHLHEEMKNEQQSIWIIAFLLVFGLSLTKAFDCYFCANCLDNQRGVRLSARSEDSCYKVVWRTRVGSRRIVSRGASADCRQDSYNDPSMSVPGVLSGTARYCCRSHLCNSAPNRISYSFFFLFSSVFVWF